VDIFPDPPGWLDSEGQELLEGKLCKEIGSFDLSGPLQPLSISMKVFARIAETDGMNLTAVMPVGKDYGVRADQRP